MASELDNNLPTGKNAKALEKIRMAAELKLEGNRFYGQKQYKEAIRRYHKYVLSSMLFEFKFKKMTPSFV